MHGLNEMIWSRIFAEFGCFDNGDEVLILVKDGNRSFSTSKGRVVLGLDMTFSSYSDAEDEVRKQLKRE